jgi:NTE family protein
MTRKKVALVLGGGGARGAYQAGLLKSWESVLKQGGKLDIISGVSAGAINAIKLVEHAENLWEGVTHMNKLWLNLSTSDIYETNFRAVVGNLFRLTRSSRKNQEAEGSITRSILDTKPLYQFLIKNVNMSQVHARLDRDPGLALIINCFDYIKMKSIAFYQSRASQKEWDRITRMGRPARLNVKHVMASCSVPIIFPTINIDGHFYGDGSLRNIAPLYPAIELGAERIICLNLRGISSSAAKQKAPSLGHVAEALFDSMFMDAVDYDAQVLNRINILTAKIPGGDSEMKVIELCLITPEINFGAIAQQFQKKFPKSLRYLLGGWISPNLLSYLLFEGEYSRVLMEQGFNDGKMYLETIEKWLLGKS